MPAASIIVPADNEVACAIFSNNQETETRSAADTITT